ncbi:MAG: PIN domain-containing protein [Nitrososphaerales archaeon]
MPTRSLLLLADTTVLYSALAYKGLENKVLLSGSHVFVTTEYTVAEIYRILTMKRRLNHLEALSLIDSMPVLVVDRDFIEGKWEEADHLIGQRDKSDIPLVALALSIPDHDGIWSSDKDFDVVRGRFRVWKSRELLKQ